MSGKNMRMVTHEQDPKVPEGYARLYLDDQGWVGTDNGCPGYGTPALFPEPQAHAIMLVWTYVMQNHPNLDELPHPEDIPEATMAWINGRPWGRERVVYQDMDGQRKIKEVWAKGPDHALGLVLSMHGVQAVMHVEEPG
jgi:hypothetical protein